MAGITIISVTPKEIHGHGKSSRTVTMSDDGTVTHVVRYSDGTYEHLTESGWPLWLGELSARKVANRELAAASAIAGSDIREAQLRASL